MTTGTGPRPPEVVPLVVETEALYRDLLDPSGAPVPKPSGFDGLDLILEGGFAPGETVFLVAPSSAGKTTFALQTALTWAERGDPVLVISQEMPRRALTRRLVSQAACVAPGALRRYAVTDHDCRKVLALITRWRTLPLLLTDQARDVTTILALIDQWPPLYGPRPALVILDYLQITHAPGLKGHERVEYVSAQMKTLAVTYGCTPLIVSSLTQEDEGGAFGGHEMRGSKQLKFDADIVLALQRKNGQATGTLVVDKGRDSRVGSVPVRFRDDVLRFEETL